MKRFQNTNTQLSSVILLIVVALCLTTAVGCGKDRPDRIKVSGKVLIDGKPLTCGTVQFIHEKARPATATIQPDGSFALKTFEDGDGLVPGNHTVVVNSKEQLSSTKIRWYVPRKYTSIRTTDQKLTIDKPNDSLNIELTWKGSPHRGPYIQTLQ